MACLLTAGFLCLDTINGCCFTESMKIPALWSQPKINLIPVLQLCMPLCVAIRTLFGYLWCHSGRFLLQSPEQSKTDVIVFHTPVRKIVSMATITMPKLTCKRISLPNWHAASLAIQMGPSPKLIWRTWLEFIALGRSKADVEVPVLFRKHLFSPFWQSLQLHQSS